MLATLLPHTEGAEADGTSSKNHGTQRRAFQESAISVAYWWECLLHVFPRNQFARNHRKTLFI